MNAPSTHNSGKAALVAELVFLFLLLPVGFRYKPFHFPPIPALWMAAAYCLWRLLQDSTFDRRLLWNAQALAPVQWQILVLFGFIASLIGVGVYVFKPQRMFIMVRHAPFIWALVMALYPALSVYPQGIIYRAFFFQRYRGLFPKSWVMIALSAMAFSFVHIIFRNWLAVIFTLIGGVLFAGRYYSTKSLYASAFEHALYGCFLFTIGLGEYFYKGPH